MVIWSILKTKFKIKWIKSTLCEIYKDNSERSYKSHSLDSDTGLKLMKR